MRSIEERPISVGFPSGVAKLVLWEGTEDEKAYTIRGKKKPYVLACGVKYYLTDDEINSLNAIKNVF